MLSVCFPQQPVEPTRRGILSQLAKIYDPLGLVSPTTLCGKLIFRDVCERKLPWDVPIPIDLDKRWRKWLCNLPETLSVKRAVAPFREAIQFIQLHAFGDASSQGVCAAVYAVVGQESGTTQGLITSKSRLSKQNLTIPRLELVAGHMAANLAVNVRDALQNCNPVIHCWLDSTVALYWINGCGEYRQFVANRVQKIQQHQGIVWHHAPTDQNPADLGSRGGSVISAPLWMNGPPWLPYPDQWPPNIEIKASSESQAEDKIPHQLQKPEAKRTKGTTDVVLDVEIAINGRPLSYLEEDVEMPVLTPSSMLHLWPTQLPELSAHHIQESDLRKRAKYLLRCKEAMWSRWSKEYVRSLRERQSKSGGEQTPHPSVGDVVIIQDESGNRNSWKLGIMDMLIVGRDGIVCGAKMRAGKGVMEQAVQHLYPLELSVNCTPKATLDPTTPAFKPKRVAAETANLRICESMRLHKRSNPGTFKEQ
ncbi:hypothetical protein ACROYT_G014258 [Oculina patagonica]